MSVTTNGMTPLKIVVMLTRHAQLSFSPPQTGSSGAHFWRFTGGRSYEDGTKNEGNGKASRFKTRARSASSSSAASVIGRRWSLAIAHFTKGSAIAIGAGNWRASLPAACSIGATSSHCRCRMQAILRPQRNSSVGYSTYSRTTSTSGTRSPDSSVTTCAPTPSRIGCAPAWSSRRTWAPVSFLRQPAPDVLRELEKLARTDRTSAVQLDNPRPRHASGDETRVRVAHAFGGLPQGAAPSAKKSH